MLFLPINTLCMRINICRHLQELHVIVYGCQIMAVDSNIHAVEGFRLGTYWIEPVEEHDLGEYSEEHQYVFSKIEVHRAAKTSGKAGVLAFQGEGVRLIAHLKKMYRNFSLGDAAGVHGLAILLVDGYRSLAPPGWFGEISDPNDWGPGA